MPALLMVLTPLKAFFLWAWGWVAPYFGPAVATAFPALRSMPGLSTLWSSTKILFWVALFAGGVWGGVKLQKWWQGDVLTESQAVRKCDNRIAEANMRAKEAALKKREAAIAAQATQIESDRAELKRLQDELARNRTPMPDDRDAVFHIDDPWLRNKL